MNTRKSTQDTCGKKAPYYRNSIRGMLLAAAALITAWALSGNPVQASNILVNPGFESDGGHNGNGITAWSCSSPGNVWINQDAYAHSGGNYYKAWGQWNGTYPNVTAIWQDKPCLPTAAFTANGWELTLPGDNTFQGSGGNLAWNEVSFRDSGGNILALYRSDMFSQLLNPLYVPGTWYNLPVTNICQTTPPYTVTGSANQLVAPPGTVTVRYQVNYYQDVTPDGGSCYYDDEVLNQVSGPIPPVISNVYPGNMLMASNHISFSVSSPSSTPINSSGIHLVVNGTDVSGSSTITPVSSSSYNVLYSGILPNVWSYTASITVTDSVGLTASSSMAFDTIVSTNLWEAEDYDFTNGLYYDSPVISSSPQANCYVQVTGALNVDYFSSSTGQAHYRTNDTTGTGAAGDSARQKFITAQLTDPAAIDYTVGYIAVGDWFNYTRDIPAGQYNIYARLASGAGATTVSFDDYTVPGSPVNLGEFTFSGNNWGAYNYIPLTDVDGNLLAFTLSGKKTFRATLTSGGDNMNFFLLVPAQPTLPLLSNISPTNTAVLAQTGTFSFTATAPSGSTINNSGIHLNLNGADVTSGLVISGSSVKSVSYPLLQSNTFYTAIIAVTNSIGSGVTRTITFDTMSTANFYVKMTDFDFNGGSYDTAGNGLVPYAYLADSLPGDTGAVSNVDYLYITTAGTTFDYRGPNALGTAITSDAPLPGFTAGNDYDVEWFNNGYWGNYTRNYPAGKYYIYGRLGGFSQNTALGKVTSGLGTTGQAVQSLGTWPANPGGWQTWAWVPLQNNGVPVVVKLGGVETLRVTSAGNCNANYYMLVPVKSINISATQSGGNAVISFPSTAGSTYRVFYSTSLTSGSWTQLATVSGNGATQSVNDPTAGGSVRFYKVTSP
jgi:hypothetical protein